MIRRGAGRGAVAVALAWAAIAAAAPALAADLPVGPAYYPPVAYPPALYNWTGIYLGGNVGAGLLSDTTSQATAAPPTAIPGTIKIDPVGLIGGGQVGANYQFAHWVVGIEASWSSSNISGTGTILTAVPNTESMTSAPAWFATATGRIGYAVNDLLFYVKGGAAEMRVNYTQAIVIPTGGSIQSMGVNRSGYTAGVGLEYGFTENLSGKFEYDFFGFGTKTYNFSQTPVSIRSDLQTLTVGLNYRFTWPGSAPVVAAKN